MAQRPPANPAPMLWGWLGYWGDRIEPLIAVVSPVALAFGSGLAVYFWDKPAPAAFLCIIGAVVGALLPVPGAMFRRREAKDDLQSDARERLMEESLPSLLELAATNTSRPAADRRATVEQVVSRVTSDLRNAFDDVTGVRVVVFRVSDDGTQMIPFQPAGRHDKPQPFVHGTPRGDKAFAVLSGTDPWVLVNDLTKEVPGAWQGTGNGYQTFITTPIRSTDDGYGLLTIDAPKADSLDLRHCTTLALYAAALGVFFAEATRNGGGAR